MAAPVPWIVALVVFAGATVAWAGGTGTDSSGSDGTSESTSTATSTSTSTSTSTATSTSGEDSTEGGGDTCGQCGPNAGDGGIVFGNLGDGTPPAGETVIEVWATPKCSCDDCGCDDDDASMIRLELDGDPVGEPCSGTQCEFTVVLTPGIHVLAAIATYDDGELSSAVQIDVPGEGSTTESGAPSDEDVDHDSNGCGCASDRGDAWSVPCVVVVAIFVAAFARPRRRPTRGARDLPAMGTCARLSA